MPGAGAVHHIKLGHAGDIRCTTVLPPKADVHPRSCYVAFVPQPDSWTAANRIHSGAIHTSHQSCCKSGKARIFTPFPESSGESRLNISWAALVWHRA